MRRRLQREDAAERARQIGEWIQSPEGQQALREGHERAARLAAEFQRAAQLPAGWRDWIIRAKRWATNSAR